MSLINQLKSIPQNAAGYFRDHRTTLENAKKERHALTAFLYILVFFVSGIAAVGGYLTGAEKAVSRIRFSYLDFSGVSFNSFTRAAIIGVLLTFLLAFNYTLTRLICIKIFTKGSKKVLAESIVDLSMHSLAVSLMFLVGGALGSLHRYFALAAILIGIMYLFIVLVNGITASVEPEKVRPRFYLIVSVFAVIGFIGVTMVLAAIFMLVVIGILKNVVNNINSLLLEIEEWVLSKLTKIEKLVNL